MLAECTGYLLVLFFLIFLLLWPGFVLQSILIGSRHILEVFVYSTAFGIAFLTIICPILDLLWNISYLSVGTSVLLLSVLFIFKKPEKPSFVFPEKWELIIFLILGYGFLLRSYTLFDYLPEGQDAWVHVSFIYFIHQTHALPQVVPWTAPPVPVTLVLYPPGSHCIGALLSEPFANLSFATTKVFFIGLGTLSVLSSYVVFRQLTSVRTALLSAFFVAVFTPHMIMTTEIIAESVAIFLYPLILYLFYQKKTAVSGILLGGVLLTHHVTAFAAVAPLLTLAIVMCIQQKSVKYFFSFLLTSFTALAVSCAWWLQHIVNVGLGESMITSVGGKDIFFNPYSGVISSLFVVLSMVGFLVLLRDKKNYYPLILSWGLTLFVGSQVVVPTMLRFTSLRFVAFFAFPGSFIASLGLLEIKKFIRKPFFILLLLLVFSCLEPPRFWPSPGEENMHAAAWLQNSTLDSVAYVYGPHYIFVYPLSDRKIYDITDYENPFTYEYSPTYFYDDARWVPHDITEVGDFDKVYSCSQVVIFRIE